MVARLGPLRAGLHMMARAAAHSGTAQGGAAQCGAAHGGSAAAGSAAGEGAVGGGAAGAGGTEEHGGTAGSGGEASGTAGEGGGADADEADAFYSLLRIEGAELPRAAPPPTLRVTLRAYQEQALWWMGQREAYDIATDVRGGGGGSCGDARGGGVRDAPHGWAAYHMPCGLAFFVHRDAGVATMSRPRGEARPPRAATLCNPGCNPI